MANKTSYTSERCKEIIDYFDVAPYRAVTKTVNTKIGPVEITEDVANDFPTLAGFARHIKVHRDTLHRWTTVHAEFKEAVDSAKAYQEHFLVVNGLKSLINTAFGIFTLKNICKWTDKQPGEDGATTVNNITVKSDQEIDLRIKELLSKKKGVA